MHNNIFIFGSCAASQVALGLKMHQDKNLFQSSIKIGYWAMSAGLFLRNDSMIFSDYGVTIKRDANKNDGKRNIFDAKLDEKMDAYLYLPRELHIPLHDEEDIVYVYASPIFPFDTFLTLVRELSVGNLYSYGMIKDVILETVKPQLKLLAFLKSINVNILVVEGPRPFRFSTNIACYQYVTKSYVTIIKSEIEKLSIPVVAIDENAMLDEDGFTKNKFKKNTDENDILHANARYGALIAKHLLSYLRSFP